MTIQASKKNPTELLAYQVELLERLSADQEQLLQTRRQFEETQLDILKSLREEADKQTKYLRNISTVATLIGLLILLSICGWIFILITSY